MISFFVNLVRDLFLWVYCLRISEAALLVVTATALYLFVHKRYGRSRPWRIILWIGCTVWLGAVAASTLGARTSGGVPNQVQLIPFHSYAAVIRGDNAEIVRSSFMNVLLFYPVGLMLGSELAPRWRCRQRLLAIAVLAACVSTGIELCQYRCCLGVAEIDDVIHNTLGAVLGVLAAGISEKVKS